MHYLIDRTRFTVKGDNFGKYTLVDLSKNNSDFLENPNLASIRLCAIKDPILISADPKENEFIGIELEDKEQFFFQGTRYVVLLLDNKHTTCDNVRILKV